MAYQTPKIDWTSVDGVADDDMNRIEGNIAELKKAATIDFNDPDNLFTATNVEGAIQELGADLSAGKQQIVNALTTMNRSATITETLPQLATKITAISSDADAAVGDVTSGKTFYQGGTKKTGTMPNVGSVSQTLTLQGQSYTVPAGRHSGAGTVTANIAGLTASVIKKGSVVGGITGTGPTYDAGGYVPFYKVGASRAVEETSVTSTAPSIYVFPIQVYDGFVYTASSMDGVVQKRNASTGALVGTCTIPGAASNQNTLNARINSAGTHLYVARSGGVTCIKMSDMTIVWNSTAFINSNSCIINLGADGHIYASMRGGGSSDSCWLYRVNSSTGTSTLLLSASYDEFTSMAYADADGTFYAATRYRGLRKFNSAGTLLTTNNLAEYTNVNWVDVIGGNATQIYVYCPNSDVIHVVWKSNLTLADTIVTPNMANGTPSYFHTVKMFATTLLVNVQSCSISQIEVKSMLTFNTGLSTTMPNNISYVYVDEATGKLYAVQNLSGTLTIKTLRAETLVN